MFNTIKLRKVLTEQGYLVSDRKKNGELFLLKKIKKNFDIFLDIGFYKGEISEFVRKINNQIKIYGFDINNLKLNKILKLKKKNIIFYNFGVFKKNINSKYYYFTQRPELSSLKKRSDYNPYISKNFILKKTKLVKMTRIFKKIKILPKSKIFLKMDIDGAESDILMSIKPLLKKYDISGYFEYGTGWKNYKKKLQTLYYFLKENNYQIYRLCKNGVLEMRYFSALDENFFQSHYFFTKKKINTIFKKKRRVVSLSSETKENFFY